VTAPPPGHRPGPQGSAARAQGFDQSVFIGEFSGVALAVDAFAIDVHVEDAATPFDQLNGGAEGGLELRSQTGRGRMVVSLDAVGDRGVHGSSLVT
jgi:hypothetical protein